jgi:transcriptional regulator with XRE-family HTH domain
MFENLRNELSKKRISNKAVADLIGCTQKTLDNKLNGVTEFTLSEILLISDNLLPEFELRYLFKRTMIAEAV